MSNDKSSDTSDPRSSSEVSTKLETAGVETAGDVIAAAKTEAIEASGQQQTAASQPAAVEALSAKLGFTPADLGNAQTQSATPEETRSNGHPSPDGEVHATTKSHPHDDHEEEKHPDEVSAAKAESLNPLTLGLGIFFYVFVGLLIAAINDRARGFMLANKFWFGLGVAAIMIIVAIAATRRWFKQTTAQRRIGMIIFAVIPLVTAAVGMVLVLPERLRAAPLTIIFLLCVCLLPAVMYYLFIATKKYSILNEFIINLDRLGLLEAGGTNPEDSKTLAARETEEERRNRILTYLQKFEAVYGAFPTDLGGLVLQPTDLSKVLYNRRINKADGSTFASIFTAETTVPVVLATVLIALGWLITLPPWRGAFGVSGDWLRIFTPERTPVHFAFIGAYFFSLQLLFRRYVRRDLRPSAYVAVSLRIILAVIGTWIAVASMTAMFTHFGDEALTPRATNQLLVLGFVIGVFPRVLWQLIRGAVKTFGGSVLRVPSLQTELPISQLDGLTVWHESRLEEEDIENVPNMATADLVDMLLNTRFPPDRIVDWVDQAILYTHLGPSKSNGRTDPRREALRTQGIRTASALVEAYIRSEAHGDREEFEKILTDPNSKRSPIRSLVDTMQTNPNLHLVQTWRGLTPHSDRHQTGNVSATNQPARAGADG